MIRLSHYHLISSIHYVIRILIGTVAIELLAHCADWLNPLWAMISLITVTDPQIKTAWTTFRARFVNTIMGCLIGLFFLFVFGLHNGLLALGISISALSSCCFTRMQQGWRIGPVTTALIMSIGLTEKSPHDAYELALSRTLAIIIGSMVALAITACLSRVWMPPLEEPGKEEKE